MATRWASAAGSNVLTGLNIDSVTYQSGVVTRYAFSASPDFSSVVAGFFLTASGCTNALNNGTFLISAVNNTTKTLDVINTAISDATSDETSSPGTGIVKQNVAVHQEPTAAKQAAGWLDGERPPAGWLNWLFQSSGRVQVATAEIGYSTISSSSYTAIGGEGRDVLPAKTSAFSQTFTAGTTSLGDITGSAISYTATAGNRVLLGYTLNALHNDTEDNSIELTLNIDGTNLTTGYRQGYSGPKEIVSAHHLITSVSAGVRAAKLQTQTSAGNALNITSGVLWGVEFAAAAAAATANQDTLKYVSATSYADIPDASLEVSISPTNNPVLLLCSVNEQANVYPTYYDSLKLTDGTNDYGEWLNGYLNSTEKSHTMAWVTGDLNGATTFKLQAKVGGNSSTIVNRTLSAIEITGDSKRAIPAGTCTISSTEATITDGSTPLSHSFTPGADIQYLAILTGYLERTAGSGYVTLKIKSGATELISEEEKRFSSTDNKIPFTIFVPTGTLASGVAATLTAAAITSDGSTTVTLKSAGFFLVEAPALTDALSGDPAEVELTDVSPGRVRVDWSSQRLCSADVALSYALYENVNAGGAVEVFSKTLTAPGTADQDCSISWLRPTDLAEGDDVTYTVRAKMASGNVVFAGGYLSATEVPSL